jgi:hypothetical protein
MSIDDYETNRFQSERKRRARKDHKCCACHETIRAPMQRRLGNNRETWSD